VKFPDAAFVKLKVLLTELKKSVTITRMVSSPKKVTFDPDEPAIRATLEEIADHPEITLSRRDILRFILVEPAKRSEEIQALLKLERIGETRRALNAAENSLIRQHNIALNQVKSARGALQLHLQIPAVKADAILEVVNKQRKTLDLPLIAELMRDTNLAEGLSSGTGAAEFNKESALRDIRALSEAVDASAGLGNQQVEAILHDLRRLENEPALLGAFRQRGFLEQGLSFVNKAECPLCDAPWPDIEHLREHLKAKLAKSEEAKHIQDALLKNAGLLTGRLVQFASLVAPIGKLAEAVAEKQFAEVLTTWKGELDLFKADLTNTEKVRKLKNRFVNGWLQIPETFAASMAALSDKIKARPDQSATLGAQTFLTKAQVRLSDFQQALRNKEAVGKAKAAAKAAYEVYVAVLEEELNALYDMVQKDFSAFYRALNGTDEAGFTAKLTPSAGSLGLDVNFYDRGLFPPAAYHSEGHQDGMGVCLYLALMRRLFDKRFTLSLLDDVVMSVDTGHRYEFCKLLRTEFPDTQFIITTHDRMWAEQMKSAGLVTGKTSIIFYSWTIDTGPLVQSNQGIWGDIEGALAKGNVDSAAAALRRHLEFVMRLLADQLGARPQFRSDGTYELDEMLSSVLKRIKALWGDAAKSAESWNKTDFQQIAIERKQFLSSCDAAMRAEQWAVNKAVHYNEWASFGKNDFKPVVAAFKELLECFRCKTCDSWIYVLPKQSPQSLRCTCSAIEFNLISKSK
jgi:hypothetical protein